MIKTHAAYIALIAILLIFGHTWLKEHDARVSAENQIKQIQAAMKVNDAQAAAQVQTVVKIVHDVKTVPQVVAAIPQVTNVPLNARVSPDNPLQVSVDAIPLINELAQAKEDSISLKACQSDLASEKQIVVALKKKPKFWKRIERGFEEVGIAVAAGFILAKV